MLHAWKNRQFGKTMKKIIVLLMTLISLSGFGYWLYLLNSNVAQEFQKTYAAFDMKVPSFSAFIIATLPHWLLVLGIVAVLSFFALFTKSKIKYLSFILPIFMSVLYFCGLYVPVITHGAIL